MCAQRACKMPRRLAQKVGDASHQLRGERCVAQLARVIRAAGQLRRRLQQLRVRVGQAARDADELGAGFVKAASRGRQRASEGSVGQAFHRGQEERRAASGCAAREQRSIALCGCGGGGGGDAAAARRCTARKRLGEAHGRHPAVRAPAARSAAQGSKKQCAACAAAVCQPPACELYPVVGSAGAGLKRAAIKRGRGAPALLRGRKRAQAQRDVATMTSARHSARRTPSGVLEGVARSRLVAVSRAPDVRRRSKNYARFLRHYRARQPPGGVGVCSGVCEHRQVGPGSQGGQKGACPRKVATAAPPPWAPSDTMAPSLWAPSDAQLRAVLRKPRALTPSRRVHAWLSACAAPDCACPVRPQDERGRDWRRLYVRPDHGVQGLREPDDVRAGYAALCSRGLS